MITQATREQLHRQIEVLPDEIVNEIADFTLYIMVRRKITPMYEDWNPQQWQDFVLGQFFQETDDVEYTLDDAREVYNP